MGREENTDFLWHDDVKITLFFFSWNNFCGFCAPLVFATTFLSVFENQQYKSQYSPTHNIIYSKFPRPFPWAKHMGQSEVVLGTGWEQVGKHVKNPLRTWWEQEKKFTSLVLPWNSLKAFSEWGPLKLGCNYALQFLLTCEGLILYLPNSWYCSQYEMTPTTIRSGAHISPLLVAHKSR